MIRALTGHWNVDAILDNLDSGQIKPDASLVLFDRTTSIESELCISTVVILISSHPWKWRVAIDSRMEEEYATPQLDLTSHTPRTHLSTCLTTLIDRGTKSKKKTHVHGRYV